MVEVIAARVIAGSAFVGPSIIQHEARDAQHADSVGAVSCVDGDAPLTGAVPQLPEGLGPIDLRVPPLDFRGGVPHYVTVQLKVVAREFTLRERGFHKASCWWRFRGPPGAPKETTGVRWRDKKRVNKEQNKDEA